MNKKILIIKLGAKGDVVRTLSIAEAVKKKFPDSELTWVTKENVSDLFEGNPFVDKVLCLPFHSSKKFDILYNFDIENEATEIIDKVNVSKKYGFYSEGGYVSGLNLGAEYYLNTLFDDEAKKNNKKTYQEMMFEAAELLFNGEKSKIYLNKKDREHARKFLQERGIDKDKLIGIHMGSAPRWPSKAWSKEKIKEFVERAKNKRYEVLLFGGPDEAGEIEKLAAELQEKGTTIFCNNPNNSNREFCALVESCNAMVCSDSFALHISLALNRKTVGLFFCTPPNEVGGDGLLRKIVSPFLYDFFPEKMDQYDEKLVNSISADEVLDALRLQNK